ncbi:FtsB family cell division protein [Corynebacterium pseudogenitalium]|uniref:Septum formation initiator family protein n=1 Tax=Corynebacterium pseudogenitalium TaxID=38303 RepID=A0ABD4TV58_9CORY|nr:septum formation initiator family protein [Corynebacterium pseudogenitalium]MCQ4615211.1 septum formation initiator family protein [Corynebacterium pseudogenitalium]
MSTGTPRDKHAVKRRRKRLARTVPVASREQRKQQLAEQKANKESRFAAPNLATLALLIIVLIAVLVAVAAPLRNFYEGRNEIARAQANIEYLERRQADLEREIAKYEDPEYLNQVARRRLGVMEPGESAWRVIDPRMTHGTTITSDETPDDRGWAVFLWDSLREVPEDVPADAPEESPAPAESPAPEAPAEAPAAPEAPEAQ